MGLLAKVCAIDLSDAVTPNGAAFRSSVGKLATDVVGDDLPAAPSTAPAVADPFFAAEAPPSGRRS